MEKIIKFAKKYKIHILSTLLFIFFVRSCQKSGEIRKLEKETTKQMDSLIVVKKIHLEKIRETQQKYYIEGFDKGANTERDQIIEFLDDKVSGPQNLKVRQFTNEFRDELKQNKHR
jgi:hypothetical protein